MTIHGAVIIEQGVTFAIIAVKQSVTMYTARMVQTRHELAQFFPNMPIILMSQDNSGTPITMGEKILWNSLKPYGLTKFLGRNITSTKMRLSNQ